MVFIILALCGLCGPAAAQFPNSPPDIPTQTEPAPDSTETEFPVSKPAAAEDGGPGPAEQEAPEAQNPMTIDDARLNFGTVVESFIAAHSPDGYWPLKQKTTGKVLKLKLDKIEDKTVRQVRPGHFKGRAVLREIDEKRLVKADFFVDFSGMKWNVEKLSLVKIKSASAPKAKKRLKKSLGASVRAQP